MYRTIDASFWTDPKVRKLSPNGRYLLLYFITNPHTHVSGIYYIPDLIAQHETGLSSAQLKAASDTLSILGFCRFDRTNELVWVVKMFRFQGNGQKNTLSAAHHLSKDVHNSFLISEFLQVYPEVAEHVKIPYPEIAVGATPIPHSPFPIPKQEQENGTEEPLAISSPVVPKYTSAFENFWEASTRRGSKLKAFGVWKRLGTFPQGELLAIYAAMVNWKNSEQWQDETKQPHISTWLGRRGWEELVPKRAIAENLRGGLIERQSLEHTTHFCGNCEVQHDWPCGELCTTGPGPRSCPEFVGRFMH